MKRNFPFLILVITISIILGCGNKEPKIVELFPIDSLGWNEDECTFKQVSDMVIIDDELFVSDLQTSEINVFEINGFNHKRCISTKGAGPKETFFPVALTTRNGNLTVSDLLNSRIKELDIEGNIISNLTGIQAYDLFEVGSDTIVRTYHSSRDIPLLHKLKGEALVPYLLFDKFKDYVKTEDGNIPWYQVGVGSKKIIYSFQNREKTTLCIDIESGEISKWSDILNNKHEIVNTILITDECVYMVLVVVKDQTRGLEPARLVKVDFSGNVINSVILNDVTPSETMFKYDNQLYLFDFDTATIKLYDLKEF